MFRDLATDYIERVDVIGNKAFIEFVEQLEKDEEIAFDTFEVGKDKLVIVTIAPDPDKMDKDILLPTLSPILGRKRRWPKKSPRWTWRPCLCPTLPRKAAMPLPRHSATRAMTSSLGKADRARLHPARGADVQEVISYYAKRIARM